STWGNWLGLCSATAKSVPLASRRHEFLTQNALLGQGRAARMSGPTPQARLRVSKQAPPHVWRPTPAGRRWGGPCEARRGCSWCGAADTRGGHDGHSLPDAPLGESRASFERTVEPPLVSKILSPLSSLAALMGARREGASEPPVGNSAHKGAGLQRLPAQGAGGAIAFEHGRGDEARTGKSRAKANARRTTRCIEPVPQAAERAAKTF
ncbi:unnamed protein product, partial [Prorocentrum cordatum]